MGAYMELREEVAYQQGRLAEVKRVHAELKAERDTLLNELFSRPSYPEMPPFFEDIYRALYSARFNGKDIKSIIITHEQFAILEDHFKLVRAWKKAWKQPVEIKVPIDTPMITTIRGIRVKIGETLAVSEEA